MSVIGFKDILVCSLVSDVQNVSWSKPMWVAQIQLTSSGSVWGLMGSVCGQWVYLSGVIHDSRPSLLTAFLCHFSPSLFLSLYPDSRTFWACLDTEHQHFRCSLWSRGQPAPTDPAVLRLPDQPLCVCVCVFKCVSLTICFSLPLVLLTCLSFQEKLIFFHSIFRVRSLWCMCVFAQFCVSTRFYTLEDTDSWNLCCVCVRVCCACLSTPPCSAS